MGPPLWADVFTLKTVNTAVYYPSQTLKVYARSLLVRLYSCRYVLLLSVLLFNVV